MRAAGEHRGRRSRGAGVSLPRASGIALLAVSLGIGCSHYSAPEPGAALVLYEGKGGVSLPPLPRSSEGTGSGAQDVGSATQGRWRFSRRAKQSLTYLYVRGDGGRPSHKLFVTLFDAPTDAWSRLPAQVLFAEMISTSKVLVIDVLPDARDGDGPTVKRGLLSLVRPGDRDPTVLAVACALPPKFERVVCGMLEETKPSASPPPTNKAELQARMMSHAEFLTAWLGQARSIGDQEP